VAEHVRVTLAFDVTPARGLDPQAYAESVARLAARTPGVENVVLTVTKEATSAAAGE
jgi:hypothetical protein